MQSDKWGPKFWYSLHTVTFDYPLNPSSENIQIYKTFFYLVSKVLPCNVCRDSFSHYLMKIPIQHFLHSRYALCYWLYIIHNIVNLKNNKPLFTFKQVLIFFENIRAGTKLTIDQIEAIDQDIQQTYAPLTKKLIEPIITEIISKKKHKK
jgi:hypothetical protein